MSLNGRDGKRTGGEGKEEWSPQRLVLGLALGGGVARRALGHTVQSSVPGSWPKRPSTRWRTAVCPSHGHAAQGRLSLWKDPLGEVSLWVLSWFLPAPTTVVTTE